MKKLALAALAISTALATPAAAQNVTGTINIQGSVQSKCFVLPNNAGNTFGTTVQMGELAKSDGTLINSATLSQTFGTAGGTGLSAQVLCTSANPDVSVTAEPLANLAPADAGYDNSIDYTADVTFTQVTGSTVVHDPSSVPAATLATLGGRLNGSGTNVTVATSAWNATGVLVSGSYNGKITIVVAPGT